MWASAAVIGVFLTAIVIASASQAIHPPSHMECVDPASLGEHPEFGKPGVAVRSDGRVVVVVVASMFNFSPDPIEVPAGLPVTFRLTSSDVIHGFEVVGTNANAMAVPGYVSQFTVTFPDPGEHLIVCNEYCGLAHAGMTGKLIVKPNLDIEALAAAAPALDCVGATAGSLP